MVSTMIVTCAGCGKRYRGQPSSKRFKCTHCGNHLTFPDAPRVAIGSYHLCSYCWSEYSLEGQPYIQCPTCSQNIVSDFGGKAMPEGAISSSAGQSGILTAATSGVMAAVQPPPARQDSPETEQEQEQQEEQQEAAAQSGGGFPSSDSEFSSELTTQHTDASRSEAEIRSEFAATVANLTQTLATERDMKKAALTERDELLQRFQDLEARSASLEARLSSNNEDKEQSTSERAELSQSHKDLEEQLAAATLAAEQARSAQEQALKEREGLLDQQKAFQMRLSDLETRIAADAKNLDQGQKDVKDLEGIVNELEAANAELKAKVHAPVAAEGTDAAGEAQRELEAKVAGLESRLANERKAKEALGKERDEIATARRELEAKIAEREMSAAADRRAKELALEEREELAEARRELDARVADLQKRINSERDAKEAALKRRDELSEQKRDADARVAELERRLASEREAREAAAKKRDELFDLRRDLEAKAADLESRLHSEKEIRESVAGEREKLTEEKKESEGRIADLETRLNLEKSAKDEMAQERDRLGDLKRQAEAKIAELERRLSSEKEAKDGASKKRDELAEAKRSLDARLADVESRLASERTAKETVTGERDEAQVKYECEVDARTQADARFSRFREVSSASVNALADDYNRAMSELATQSSELLNASKATRKRIEEADKRAQQSEAEAARLQTRLEALMLEVSSRLNKVLPDAETLAAAPEGNGAKAATSSAAEGAVKQEDGSWLLADSEVEKTEESEEEMEEIGATSEGTISTVRTPVGTPAILADKLAAPAAAEATDAEASDETPGGGGLAEEYPEVEPEPEKVTPDGAKMTSSARMQAAQKPEGSKTFFTRLFGKKS